MARRTDPDSRLGVLLTGARRAAGLTLEQVSDAANVPVAELAAWEQGTVVPTDRQLAALASAYDTTVPELLPRRQPLALDLLGGALLVGTDLVPLPVGPHDNEAVLTAYAAAVRRQRGLAEGAPIPLRRDDVEMLAELLEVDDAHLERRLQELVGLSARTSAAMRVQLLRRRVLRAS